LLNKIGAWDSEYEEVKKNKKILYHFEIFVIVNELLIIKNRHINPAYCLMQARDKMSSIEVASSDRGC